MLGQWVRKAAFQNPACVILPRQAELLGAAFETWGMSSLEVGRARVCLCCRLEGMGAEGSGRERGGPWKSRHRKLHDGCNSCSWIFSQSNKTGGWRNKMSTSDLYFFMGVNENHGTVWLNQIKRWTDLFVSRKIGIRVGVLSASQVSQKKTKGGERREFSANKYYSAGFPQNFQMLSNTSSYLWIYLSC